MKIKMLFVVSAIVLTTLGCENKTANTEAPPARVGGVLPKTQATPNVNSPAYVPPPTETYTKQK